jgi:hypothetical protein
VGAFHRADEQHWDDPARAFDVSRGLLALSVASGRRDEAVARVGRNLEAARAIRQPNKIFGAMIDEAMMSAFLGDPSQSPRPHAARYDTPFCSGTVYASP